MGNQILNEKNEELKFLSTETELNKKNEEIIIQLEHQISDLKDQNALQAKEIENQEFELDHANEQNERQEDRIQKHKLQKKETKELRRLLANQRCNDKENSFKKPSET